MRTPPLLDGVEAVHVITRPPTWRDEPLTLSYLLLGFEPNGLELADIYRWARSESLANPRVISPRTLVWSEFFNPRFFAAIRDAGGVTPGIQRASAVRLPDEPNMTRIWAESVLFLAGVTMSAAIVQSRWSRGTLASKYDRLWQAGCLAKEGVLPELSGLSLAAQVLALVAEKTTDQSRLLAIRALFMQAIGALTHAPPEASAKMAADPLPPDRKSRFGFIVELRRLLGDDLAAIVVYGSSVNSENFADYDLLIVSHNPETSLKHMAGLSPTWHGKELNVGVYSPSELWNMQLLSGDNLIDYGLCIVGELEVPVKPIDRLLARNFSFGMIRQRQQLGMIPMALEHPYGCDGDNLRSLYEYFVKIPANVVKGTLGVTNSKPPKELIYKWLADRCGFDTDTAQQRATAGEPADALADAAVATGAALRVLNQDLGLLAEEHACPTTEVGA
jgi:hypothetical protein